MTHVVGAATSSSVPTLLLTLTGPDRPGVTTALMSALCTDAEADLAVVDMEQVVVRGRLVLGDERTRAKQQ